MKGEQANKDIFHIGILEKSLERHLEWIRQIDTKAQMFIAIDLALVSALISMTPASEAFNLKVLIAILVGCALPVWSLHQCFSTISPHLRPSERNSILFFRDISRLSVDEYSKQWGETAEVNYISELIDLNYINALIADAKYVKLKRITIATFISLPLMLGSVSVFYFEWYK